MNVPERMYKFGKTSFSDVLKRFDKEEHVRNNWRATPLSEDYHVRVLWSKWVTRKDAAAAEKWFRESYPKTFFGDKDYNGITECRDWDSKQSYAFFRTLKERFSEAASTDKTACKVYFVMLTKKQV